MSQGTTVYRFQLEISDVDRSVYETVDLRLAKHASESNAFLLSRLIAYALNLSDGLAFSPKGLGDPDIPCISSDDPRGGKNLWIEIGNPSAARLHKASKAARKVRVYTYKSPEALVRELQGEKIHHLEQIELYYFKSEFLEELENALDRDNSWTLLRDQESLAVHIGDHIIQGELLSFPLL